MDAVTASNICNNHHGSTKTFFIHTLEHLTTSNIITPYTRDKLIDMINSDSKRDFADGPEARAGHHGLTRRLRHRREQLGGRPRRGALGQRQRERQRRAAGEKAGKIIAYII